MRISSASSRIVAFGSALVLLVACDDGSVGPSAVRTPRSAPRGIVLVTVDGLVPAELALFGGTLSAPALERLAREGRAWADGWSPCPMTRPAAATYLTGLAPDAHRVLDDAFDRLNDDVPTLATLLVGKGFRTAAFPGTSLLGAESGLLRGFEVVDDPPPSNFGAARRVGELTRTEAQGNNVATWLRSLGAGTPFFAWIHSSLPVRDQMAYVGRPRAEDDLKEESAVPRGASLAEFDRLLGGILAVLDEIAVKDAVTVVVAGTYGDVSGGESRVPGPGFALDVHTLRVPIVARLQPTLEALRDAQGAVWAPDVATTLAEQAGVQLPRQEGVSLGATPAADRPMYAWTRATLDQLGWPTIAAVRVGTAFATSGLESNVSPVAAAPGGSDASPPPEGTAARLGALLATRPVPAGSAVTLDEVAPALASRGLEIVPRPRDGRAPATHEARVDAATGVWRARIWLSRKRPRNAIRALERATNADPESLAGLVELGQLHMNNDLAAARSLLDHAITLYPTAPEAVHWFVHMRWEQEGQPLAPLWEAVLRAHPHDADVTYDVACARSRSGDLAGAETYLRRAIDAGFRDWGGMEVDPDLRALRESGRFGAIMREYRR